MAGGGKDYPEHYKAGLKRAHIREKCYHARSPQGHNLVNRMVDISSIPGGGLHHRYERRVA